MSELRAVAATGPVLDTTRRVIEVGRPVVLFAVFLAAERLAGLWAAPLALVAVFAFAILVHDLIHDALRLGKPWSDLALALFALFLLKSGHALRESHVRHHRLCLSEADEEGRVAHRSIPALVVLGPWIAIRARWVALRDGRRSRAWQLAETAANLLLFAALVRAALSPGSSAPALYLGAVVLVTLTAPIWGAKVPHTLPDGHPLVLWARARVGRWMPAASSVVFHELHHRAPRIPVSLLSEHRDELERRPPSPCEPPP